MKRLLLAFALNVAFALFETVGGICSGSVAILSDAVHDMGDAVAIGISLFLEAKSTRPPDERHPEGYGRYSAISSVLTCLILMIGSLSVMTAAVGRLFHPAPIRSGTMLLVSAVGLCINGAAALVTRRGESSGHKAIHLHMLEDVLGWAAVLIGSLVIYLTDFTVIDPLLSVAVSLWVLVHAAGHLKQSLLLLRRR